MSKITKRYKLKIALPRYEKNTIFIHEYEELPSIYGDGTYSTDGEWTTVDGVIAIDYVPRIIKRAITDQNVNTSDWVEEQDNE